MNGRPLPRILIVNGRVIDPSQSFDRTTNLLIADGRIAAYDAAPDGGETLVIDAAERIVAPGLIDMHAELREPGGEDDETIATGVAAAVAGGFTSLACLPNTEPPLDSQAGVQYVRQQARALGRCRVHVLACASKSREGKELSEMGALAEAGAIGFTDAPAPIHNPELLRRALQYSQMFGKPVLNHPEMPELTRDGVMHEGLTSLVLGLSGLPAEAEDVMTARDVRLCEATGGRLHLLNVSSSGSVDILRRSKARGVKVTASVCPQHFTLTDEGLREFDPRFKVNPPLRSQEHVDAVIAGLADGTLDCIASGHTPRAPEKKLLELDRAPFGMVGLETALALVITELVLKGRLDWLSALAKLTCHPARVLGLAELGTLRIGAPADVTIIDPHARWTVAPERFRSKSTNTPLAGRELTGRAEKVLVGGRLVGDEASP